MNSGQSNRQAFQKIDFFLLRGEHGTGKTVTLHSIIRHCIAKSQKVLVCCPTGFLAATYKALFGNQVCCDTVHSSFKIAVSESDQNETNWSLRMFDVILIDEISMIPKKFTSHILTTISSMPRRPIIVFCGDPMQLQPFGETDEECQSLFEDAMFLSQCRSTSLHQQFRTNDTELHNFLTIIRHWCPSKRQLEEFCHGIVLDESNHPSPETILSAWSNTHTSFLTFTNQGCHFVNSVIIEHLFSRSTTLGFIFMGSSYEAKQPIYEGMLVRITENRDKSRRYVNGQVGKIALFYKRIIMLQIEDEVYIRMYPVTNDSSGPMYYPLVPAYASTIHKSQGQNMRHAVLWFDCKVLPAGCAYVAMSRVKKKANLRFLVKPTLRHFRPKVLHVA